MKHPKKELKILGQISNSPNVSDDIVFRKNLESLKFTFEIAKHLTTLSSGLIVIFTTIVASIVKAIDLFSFIFVASFFLGSIVLCVVVMIWVSIAIRSNRNASNWPNIVNIFAFLAFCIGLLFIASYILAPVMGK